MRTNSEQLFPLTALLLQWRALGHLAVAFAREMSLFSKFNPREGLQKAETLEVWLRFALFSLVGDLARLQADGEDHVAHSAELQHLRQIAAALAMLMTLTAHMKRQMENRLGGAWCDAWPALRDLIFQPMRAEQIPETAYLDSS